MKTALVTGHRGFVGRHLARTLSDSGWHVTGVDLAELPDIGIQKEYTGDCRNYFDANLQATPPDLAVHCAAATPYRKAIDRIPGRMGADNLSLDADFFRWVQAVNPGHTVYISSSAAYPVSLQTGEFFTRLSEGHINADTPQAPDGIYGWTKLTGERLAGLASSYNGVSISVVRPFSGYGEDQSTRFPFGAFAIRALAHNDPFVIWGDGKQVRDWVHIDDIVGAILRIVDLRITGPVNIGTGIGVSMMEVARLMCGLANYTPTFELKTSAPSGVSYRVCNPLKLNEIYKPGIDLGEGIQRVFD